jgi:hypothetical protein
VVVGVKDSEQPAASEVSSNGSSNGAAQQHGVSSSGHAVGGGVSSAAAAVEQQQQAPAAAVAPQDPAGGGVAHRWRIVLMMSVAFVLCNMDKVRLRGCAERGASNHRGSAGHQQLLPAEVLVVRDGSCITSCPS